MLEDTEEKYHERLDKFDSLKRKILKVEREKYFRENPLPKGRLILNRVHLNFFVHSNGEYAHLECHETGRKIEEINNGESLEDEIIFPCSF